MNNWLDDAIAWFSPGYAARRSAARYALEQARHFERLAIYPDAIQTAIDPPVTGRGVSADYALELGRDRRFLVDRVETLERDNALACALLDRSTEAVVGAGFRYQAKTGNEAWNKKAQELWTEWCERENCDDRELINFDKMSALTFRGKMRDGEAGFVKLRARAGDKLGGRLRPFESADLGTPEAYYKPSAVDGLELDDRMRPKTFHLFRPSPDILWSDRRVSGLRDAVPAKDVVFTARRLRIGQTRGITAFLGGFWALEQLKGAIESVTVALRMAACFGLVINKVSATTAPPIPNPSSSSGQSRSLNLAPGQALYLQPGEQATQIQPAMPGSSFDPHAKLLSRWAAMAFGITVEQATGDFSDNNFSNTKANILHAWSALAIIQHEYLVEAMTPILYWKLQDFMQLGLLAKNEEFKLHKWRVPGQLWIDPVDDIQAAMARVDAGMDTRGGIVARHGGDFDEIVAELDRENKLLEAAGVEPMHSSLTRDDRASAPAPAAPGAPPGGGTRREGEKKKERATFRTVRERIARDLRRPVRTR